MKKDYIRNSLAAAGIGLATGAALLSGGQGQGADGQGADGQAQVAYPTVDLQRAEIFLPHYARIQGIFENLPGAVPASQDLVMDMGRLHMRFMDMEHLAEPERQADYFAEGAEIAAAGQFTADSFNGYVIAVLDADDLYAKAWCDAVSDMESFEIMSIDANYLALHAMAPDPVGFEGQYPLRLIAGEQVNLQDWLTPVPAAWRSYETAAGEARSVFERLDQARMNLAVETADIETAMSIEP